MRTAIFRLAVLCFWLTACATTYRDLKPGDVKEGRGVAIAKVRVLYNGIEFTKNCSVCLESVNGPCQKLDENGIVFIPLKTGESRLRRLQCQDVSPQHFNLENAKFQVRDGVNYIGDLRFEWENKGGLKPAALFGLLGALVDEGSNDGRLEVSVTSSPESLKSLIQVYKRQMALAETKTTVSLLKVGR